MKILFIAFLAVLFHFTSCDGGKEINVQNSKAVQYTNTGNGNDFVDQLIRITFLAFRHELDPHPLPDIGLNVSKKVFLVTYRAQAQLHEGWLSGLSSIHRDDDATMEFNEDGLNVVVHLGMGVLKYDYKGTFKLMGVGPSVQFYGTIGYIAVEMVIVAEPSGGPKLKKFKIKEMKSMEVEIRGLNQFNFFMKVMSKAFINVFKPIIIKVLEGEVKAMVAEKVKTLQLPMYK